MGFSPRKAEAVLYLTGGLEECEDLLAGLGQHRTGKGCIYITRIDEVDPSALRQLIASRAWRAHSRWWLAHVCFVVRRLGTGRHRPGVLDLLSTTDQR